MKISDIGLMVAVFKAAGDMLRSEETGARDQLREALLTLHGDTGAKSLDVRLPNGEQVATVTLPLSKAAPVVDDERALMEWATDSRPEWLVEVPATVKLNTARIFEEVTFTPDGEAVTAGGEIVPGVRYDNGGKPGAPSVRFASGGRQAIASAWSDGVFGNVLPGVAPCLPEVTE